MKRLPVTNFAPEPILDPCQRSEDGPAWQLRSAAACCGLRIGKRAARHFGVRHFGVVLRPLLVCLLLVLPFAGSAQSLSDFYAEHAAQPEFASISLEPKMMRMMSRRAKEGGDEELAELLDGIEQIRVLVLREGDREAFAAEVRWSMEIFGYERLSVSQEEGRTTEFYLHEGGKWWQPEASGFVMLTFDDHETVWMNIYGVFDVRDVGRLTAIRPK